MLKILSVMLIAAAFALGGRYIAAFQSKRVSIIKDIMLMISVIETQLRYACLPVTDLLRVLSENESLGGVGFIKPCRERVSFGEAFPPAWRESVEQDTELCRLLGESKAYLIQLGADIGATDIEGQLSCCEYYKQIFSRQLDLQEEKSVKYSKLFPPLGLMLGLCAAIIIV